MPILPDSRRIICDKCNRSLFPSGYAIHYPTCKGPKPPKKIRGIDFDPNIGYKNGTRKAWNKGLTSDTNSSVAKGKNTLNRRIDSGEIVYNGTPCSEETKQKLSDIRIKFLNENPDKVPYKLNHSSKQSYPEKYFTECFKDLTIESEYRVIRYSLDFANPLTKRYVEIDGEQHYVDSRIVEHDIKRTLNLTELGWEAKRIRWKQFSKLKYEEKKLIVDDLIEFLK